MNSHLSPVGQWAYDEYSEWSRLLAKNYSLGQLRARLAQVEHATEKAKGAHLRSIQNTTSMAGQSQRRAHSRNAMVGSYEESCALRDAIAIQESFPEHAQIGAAA